MFTKADIEKYFTGEKQESLLFLGIGIAAVFTALVFFFLLKTSFYKGAAIPVFLIGVILGIVGYTIYKRSDNDRIRNVYAYDMNPVEIKEKELPRMEAVMKNFVLFRWIELFLFVAGAGLYIYFIRDFTNDFRRGLGLALAVMAIIALTADYFAETRGKKYIKGLKEFVQATR